MSDIDLQDLDPALKQADLEELIKEARSKIKPVIKAMTNKELESLIMREEDAEGNKKIIINKPRYYGLLEQHGITIEELRKIQDKHYEVDIEFELTRDLYEKQRIVDGYLQEH